MTAVAEAAAARAEELSIELRRLIARVPDFAVVVTDTGVRAADERVIPAWEVQRDAGASRDL